MREDVEAVAVQGNISDVSLWNGNVYAEGASMVGI